MEATSKHFVNKSRVQFPHIYFSLYRRIFTSYSESSEHIPVVKRRRGERTAISLYYNSCLLTFNQVKKNTFFLFSIIKYVNFIHFMKKNNDKKIKTETFFFSLSLFVNLESSCIA